MTQVDPRRLIPRTDQLLALPAVQRARIRLGEHVVQAVVRDIQEQARRGDLAPDQVQDAVVASLAAHPSTTLRPVLNATGVVVHTNLGRAPLAPGAVEALISASGYVDVELDLATGTRSKRGVAVREALLIACPAAQDALVVNNGAAALVLATTALAAGKEVVVSRGELIEIGAGFRLPDLIASTGARLREVGTTNRTHLKDYADAIGPQTGCVLKVHPSNFRVEGFTTAVALPDLRPLTEANAVPLVADLGSGLLAPDPLLPDEPDAATSLSDGADVVTASGDKLLGGPAGGRGARSRGCGGPDGTASAGARGPRRQTHPRRARGDRPRRRVAGDPGPARRCRPAARPGRASCRGGRRVRRRTRRPRRWRGSPRCPPARMGGPPSRVRGRPAARRRPRGAAAGARRRLPARPALHTRVRRRSPAVRCKYSVGRSTGGDR